MKLRDKVEEIKTLTVLTRTGWDQKKIFLVADCHDKTVRSAFSLNPGWGVVLDTLGDHFPTYRGGVVGDDNCSYPSHVISLIEEAEAFLTLVSEKKVDPAQQASLNELRGDVAEIIYKNSLSDATDKILRLLHKKYKFF